MSLPNELVDSIIENLFSDRTTLLNCALVGRAWTSPSQRGIFQRIVLDLPRPYNTRTMVLLGKEEYLALTEIYLKATGQLVASFDANPRLATYVQSLELQWFPNKELATNLCTATASVVRRLSNVKNLLFLYVYWGCMPPFLREALFHLFRAPSLTQVSFTNFVISTFAEMASLLSHASHLKVLKVRAEFGNHDLPDYTLENGSIHPPRSIQLHELKLNIRVHSFLAWFQHECCPFDIRNLQVLRVGGVNAFVDVLGLVKYVGGNLRELQLSSLQVNDLNNYLQYTPNLCILHTSLWPGDSYAFIPVIKALFRPILNPDGKRFPLQCLIIDLPLQHDPMETQYWDQWADIDVLFQKPEFALLETVEFNVSHIWHEDTRALSGVGELLGSKLPFLEGSGKLVVHILV